MLMDVFDPDEGAVIDPRLVYRPVEGFPALCIGVFSKPIVEDYVKRYQGEVLAEISFCTGKVPVWKIMLEGTPVALTLPHVGAPASVGMLENMAAWGGKAFVFFGSCGVLRHDIADGHLIVPSAAVRDEGTSFHYQPPAEEIELEPACVQAVTEAMEELGLPYVTGKTWTTDAFYRETRKRMEQRKAQGCVCVEMECAALAAACRFRGLSFAEFFYAADNLDTPEWDKRGLHLLGTSVADRCMAAALATGKKLLEQIK